jgi:hypothetical protein
MVGNGIDSWKKSAFPHPILPGVFVAMMKVVAVKIV